MKTSRDVGQGPQDFRKNSTRFRPIFGWVFEEVAPRTKFHGEPRRVGGKGAVRDLGWNQSVVEHHHNVRVIEPSDGLDFFQQTHFQCGVFNGIFLGQKFNGNGNVLLPVDGAPNLTHPSALQPLLQGKGTELDVVLRHFRFPHHTRG